MLGYPKHGGKDEENLTHFFRHYRFISCIGQSSKARVSDNKIACGEHASNFLIRRKALCVRRRRFVFGLLQQAFAQRQKLVAPSLIFLC